MPRPPHRESVSLSALQVSNFLTSRHYGGFKIFNLCEAFEEFGNGNYEGRFFHQQVVRPLPLFSLSLSLSHTLSVALSLSFSFSLSLSLSLCFSILQTE